MILDVVPGPIIIGILALILFLLAGVIAIILLLIRFIIKGTKKPVSNTEKTEATKPHNKE
jgi:hypothetical protein